MVVWITGRPSAGKTTLGIALVSAFCRAGRKASLVDSDEVRAHLTPHATFEPDERALVYRAIAYVARRLSQEDIIAVVAATAHDPALRDAARAICPVMLLVYARCDEATCEGRDPRGLYRRARAGGSLSMPGVQVPFVEPLDAHEVVDTSLQLTAEGVEALAARLLARM